MYTVPVKIDMTIPFTVRCFSYIGYEVSLEVTPEFVSSPMNLIAFLPSACYLMAGFVMIFYGLTYYKVAFCMEVNQK